MVDILRNEGEIPGRPFVRDIFRRVRVLPGGHELPFDRVEGRIVQRELLPELGADGRNGEGFGAFLEKYQLWSSYTPEENSVLLAYASVYGHTENAANILAVKLCERGVRVRMYDTSVTPASYIVSDAFRCSHLVFAATTYNNGVFVTMENLLHDLAAHNLQKRRVAVIENGSWAPASGKLMRELLSPLKNIEFVADNITLKSALADGQDAALDALADQIAAEIAAAKAEA